VIIRDTIATVLVILALGGLYIIANVLIIRMNDLEDEIRKLKK
jgi:uncharacterized integral membrane protein